MKYKEPEIIVPELEKLVGTYHSRYWTKKAEGELRKYWGKVPLPALATHFEKSPEAVRMKAKNLGLQDPRRMNACPVEQR